MPIIPTTWEVEIGELQSKASLGKKLARAYGKNTSQAWWCTLVIPASQEVKVGRLWYKAAPGKNMRPSLEKNKTK
jgi:hypothetical protein